MIYFLPIYLGLASLTVLSGCCCKSGPILTYCAFQEVSIGTPIETIRKDYGEPVSVRSCGKEGEIYEYIERFHLEQRPIESRRYYFFVKDGRVVAKRVCFKNPYPYQFDGNVTPSDEY